MYVVFGIMVTNKNQCHAFNLISYKKKITKEKQRRDLG